MELQTERLTIRPLEKEDAEAFSMIRNQEFVMKYNVLEKITKEDAEEIIENCKKELTAWGIFYKDNAELIGVIFNDHDSLRYRTGTRGISYWLSEEYSGKGLMPEALKAFMNKLFEDGYVGITIRVFEDNERSMILAKKLGFVEEGRLQNAVKGSFGDVHNDVLFYMSKENFVK